MVISQKSGDLMLSTPSVALCKGCYQGQQNEQNKFLATVQHLVANLCIKLGFFCCFSCRDHLYHCGAIFLSLYMQVYNKWLTTGTVPQMLSKPEYLVDTEGQSAIGPIVLPGS